MGTVMEELGLADLVRTIAGLTVIGAAAVFLVAIWHPLLRSRPRVDAWICL